MILRMSSFSSVLSQTVGMSAEGRARSPDRRRSRHRNERRRVGIEPARDGRVPGLGLAGRAGFADPAPWVPPGRAAAREAAASSAEWTARAAPGTDPATGRQPSSAASDHDGSASPAESAAQTYTQSIRPATSRGIAQGVPARSLKLSS